MGYGWPMDTAPASAAALRTPAMLDRIEQVAIVALWLAVGVAGLASLHRLSFVAHVLFPAGALIGLGLAAIGALALFAAPETLILPIGLPQLPFHLRLDALAAFFLIVLGAAGAGISLFAAGYFRAGEGTPPGLLCLQYHGFLASMAMVESMQPGSVIVDLAAERGGNVELTQPGEVTTTPNGVTIIGYRNVPARLATSASQLFARNLVAFLETMFDKKTKAFAVNWDDELVKATVLTRDGAIVHPNIKVAA